MDYEARINLIRTTEHVLFVATEYARGKDTLKHNESKWRTHWCTIYRMMEDLNIDPIMWSEGHRNPVDAFTFLEIMERHLTSSRTVIAEIYTHYLNEYLR